MKNRFSSLVLSTVLACGTAGLAVSTTGCGLFNQGVQKYDTLVDKDEACQQAWGEIDNQLARRAALIPQLVGTVKGYAMHEEKTLTEVQEARSHATQVHLEYKPGQDDFSDPAKMAQFQKAQGDITTALGKLMSVQERYPDLKANTLFSSLMVEIAGSENRLAHARTTYNTTVSSYNTELRHVSGKVINPVTGFEFKPRVYFQATDAEKAAPTVDFNK